MLTTQADLIDSISLMVADPRSQDRFKQLEDFLQSLVETNTTILRTMQTQQLQANLPPEVELQKPIIFEDAHGRLMPFHVEFINSFAAFQAVLEVRFSEVPGLRKVKKLEYVMQDTASKKALDLGRPWESIFRPGRKVIMSILFQEFGSTPSTCPACLEDDRAAAGEGTHIQW